MFYKILVVLVFLQINLSYGNLQDDCENIDDIYQVKEFHVNIRKLFKFLIVSRRRKKEVVDFMMSCGTLNAYPVYESNSNGLKRFKQDCRILKPQVESIQSYDTIEVNNSSSYENAVKAAILEAIDVFSEYECSHCPCVINEIGYCVTEIGKINGDGICEVDKGVNINLGGNKTRNYAADTNDKIEVWGSMIVSQVENTKVGTLDEEYKNVLSSSRSSSENWGLNIYGVSHGHYNCVLSFIETSSSVSFSGKRVFKVSINGKISKSIDVFAEVGNYKPFRYIIEEVPVPWRGSETLQVTVLKEVGDSMLSGLSCERSLVLPELENVFVNVGGNSYAHFINDENERIEVEGLQWTDEIPEDVWKNITRAFDYVPYNFRSYRIGWHWDIAIKDVMPGEYSCTFYFFGEISLSTIIDLKANGNQVQFNFEEDRVRDYASYRLSSSVISGIEVPWGGKNDLQVSLFEIRGYPWLSSLVCNRSPNNSKTAEDMCKPSVDLNFKILN